LRQVAQEMGGELENLYERIAWPLYKKFKIETPSDEKKVCLFTLVVSLL
jgi:translation initiation factor 2 subunit 1